MTSEKKNKGIGRISACAITGLFGLASVIDGCRSPCIAPTEEDFQRARIFEKYRAGNYASNLKYDSAREGLEDVIQGESPAASKYDALGPEYSRLAKRIERSNYLTKNTLAGADARVLKLYDKLNKKGKKDNLYENLNKEQKEKLAQTSRDLDSFTNEFCGENRINYEALIGLKEQANSLGNKELEGKVDNLIREFKENAKKLKTRIELKRALYVSEGIYDVMGKDIQIEDILERIYTGVGYSDIQGKVIEKIFPKNSLEERINHIAKHIKSDGAVDRDKIVREHRFEIVNPLWKLYSEGKIDGKELQAAVYLVDSMIAEKAADTPKPSRIKNIGKEVLSFVIPLAPLYKIFETGSHMGTPDTAEEFVAGKKDADSSSKLESVIRYLRLLELGATNGGHVVGNKPEITEEMIFSIIEQAGQLALIYGFERNAGEEASKGGAGGGSGGGGAPGTPIDW